MLTLNKLAISSVIVLGLTVTSWADGISNPGGSSSITSGTTTTTCADTTVIFSNAGIIGCDTGLTKASGTTGAVTLGGLLALPDTSSSTVGLITFGGARFLHDAGANSNVFLGHNAANTSIAVTQSVCVGESCMLSGVSGTNNTCVGRFCMGGALAGTGNTALGSAAMSAVTNGGSNVGIGNGANAVTTASNTTCVGASACGAATGSSTSAFGFNAGLIATGANNTLVGATAGNAVSSGTTNTFVGSASGTAISTTSGNTIVGQGCAGTAGNANTILLGNAGCAAQLDFGKTAASVWTFVGGTLAIPSIASDATHTDATICEDTTTHQLFSGSGTLGICLGTSSMRFKHDIAPLQAGLEELLRVDTVTYYYNADHGNPSQKLYGFTAEQMQTVLPELVHEDAEGRANSIDWAGLVPVLVRSIQQQQVKIDELRRQVH